MTSSVIRKYVLAALCGAAIIGVGQSAQAATWDIVLGVPSAPSTPTVGIYGPFPNQNNVVNNPPAQINDTINVPVNMSIFQNSNLNATFVGSYNVNWFYLGSESDNPNDFAANGVPLANGGVIGYQETNANNNCGFPLVCGASAQIGPQLMGTATNQTALTPFFEFRDQTDGSNVVNGANNTDTGGPNFLISYATLVPGPGAMGGTLFLTTSVSDWVVFGYNDTGFPDDNHDDFIVAAHITDGAETPIPGALPLFASVLGGGFLFRRLRNRRQAKAAA